MDFARIKNLVKKNGNTCILVEGGEPEIVVMTFDEYEKLANGNTDEIRWESKEENVGTDAVDFSSANESETTEKNADDSLNDFISELYGNASEEKESANRAERTRDADTHADTYAFGAENNDFKDLRGADDDKKEDDLPLKQPLLSIHNERDDEDIAESPFFDEAHEKQAGLRLENVRLEDLPL